MLPRFLTLLALTFSLQADPSKVEAFLQEGGTRLRTLYEHFHKHPELSLLEENTARRYAAELKQAGFETAERVGGHGVVGVLRNGEGPTLMLRADLDALPVQEQTGLPYASKTKQKSTAGEEVPVMHACGHDMHMTVALGAAGFLAQHRELWRGTLVVIGQPAEERGAGAKAMLRDGLFERFPKPDYCLALHVDSARPAGRVSFVPGYMLANVDSVDITIRGVGGHGAYPHKSKDPIVLASQVVLALQTLISREKDATESGVITVGSIHGGTKHNIIPDEVKLQLTVRSYTDQVRTNLLQGIDRVVTGLALAAGIPADRMPIVKIDQAEYTPAAYNNVELTERWAAVLRKWLGEENVRQEKPQMGGEDFGMYGRTEDRIPICMMWLGAVPAERIAQGNPPPIHSPFFYPDPDLTIKTGVTTLVAGVLDLLRKD